MNNVMNNKKILIKPSKTNIMADTINPITLFELSIKGQAISIKGQA